MAGVDRDLLASHLRTKMDEEKLSLRRAAESVGCSPATLSRLLQGSQGEYVPDTATLEAMATWLGMTLSEFEPRHRPAKDSSSLAKVEMHLHALPELSQSSATAIMDVVRVLYDRERERSQKKS